ncbi:MAG TPA: branched-chain amino acid ABC transporter permease [Stellaceae bacterium]|nr:branched-chain amino acid ABC transporter permease [Stellaceae bacterium]
MTTPQQETVPLGAAVARPTTRLTTGHWLLAGAIAVALVLPFVFRGFVIFQLTEVMIYGLAILGLNLLTGFNGQFSVGHGAFFGLGAYVTAIMMQRWNVPYYWTLPPAGLVCFVVGVAFGVPALRLRGLYIALVTFAAAVALPQLLKFNFFEGWTGGVQGIVVNQPGVPAFLPVISADQWLYFFTLAVVLLMFWGASNLAKSRSGRAIMAIRDHDIAAAAMGINANLYKTLTFGVSALYTGVAGALSALAVQFVAPDSFGLFVSIYFLVGLILGGIGSLWGCLFGGLFVLYVPNLAQDISRGLSGVFFGLIMLLVIFVMPSGAAGFARLAGAWVRRRVAPPMPPPGRANLAAPEPSGSIGPNSANLATTPVPEITEQQPVNMEAPNIRKPNRLGDRK